MGKTAQAKELKRQYDTSNVRYEEHASALEDLIPQYQEQYDSATANIDDLFANNPELDLSRFSNELLGISSNLSGFSEELGKYKGGFSSLSNKLGGIQGDTESGVKKYLSKGDEYISSMLDETNQGADKYLGQYKKLAQTEMPGMSIYRDQEQSNLGSSLQMLKSLGGTSSNAVASLLSGNQQAKAGMALQASNYKTQSQRDLAEAYMNAGTIKSGSLANAAGFTQGQAGIRQGLGEFSAGITGQQAGMIGAQAGLTGQQIGIEGDKAGISAQGANLRQNEFAMNEYNPWLQELQWGQTQAQMFNPLDFAANVHGNLTGLNWSGAQGYMGMQMENKQNQTQNAIELASITAEAANSYNSNK